MSSYLTAVWRLRYFWLSLARMDLRMRYGRTWLGIGWSLMHPIAMTAVLCTVFHKLFGLDWREYAPSLLTGLCFWQYITTATTFGCQCLIQGEPYIRQYPAPIAIYPLRTALVGAFHFLMALVVVLGLIGFLKGFENVFALGTLVPTFVLLLMFGWTLALLAGFANTYFPDTQHLCEVGLQILFYGTPIIYPAEILRKRGLGWIVDYNPLAAFIELFRNPIVAGRFPSSQAFAVAGAMVLCVSCAAVLILVRFQKRVIFQL